MVVAQEKIEWQQSQTGGGISRPTRKRKKVAKGKSILALLLIVGTTAAIGAETIQLTVVKGAQISSIQKEIADLKEQNDLLQVEADKLRSVSRIESAALAMGMEKPAGTVYVTGPVPAANNQNGASSTQAASPSQGNTQTSESKPSKLYQLSQLFTSFFASTQR